MSDVQDTPVRAPLPPAPTDPDRWTPTVAVTDLQAAGKTVVDVAGTEILLLWFEERAVAMANRCIHRDRELSPGILLKGRIVCPGHQWSFDLTDGWCKERDKAQPVHHTRVNDQGIIEVALVTAPPA